MAVSFEVVVFPFVPAIRIVFRFLLFDKISFIKLLFKFNAICPGHVDPEPIFVNFEIEITILPKSISIIFNMDFTLNEEF